METNVTQSVLAIVQMWTKDADFKMACYVTIVTVGKKHHTVCWKIKKGKCAHLPNVSGAFG